MRSLTDFLNAVDELESPPLLILIAKTKLRFFYDGESPTASMGHIIEPDEVLTISSIETLTNLRLNVSN